MNDTDGPNNESKGAMSDTKLLGLCILLAAAMISGTIIWSTNAKLSAMATSAPANAAFAPASATSSATSVTITGPVTLAPFTTPIPVTLSTPEGAPISVKDVPSKQWTR